MDDTSWSWSYCTSWPYPRYRRVARLCSDFNICELTQFDRKDIIFAKTIDSQSICSIHFNTLPFPDVLDHAPVSILCAHLLQLQSQIIHIWLCSKKLPHWTTYANTDNLRRRFTDVMAEVIGDIHQECHCYTCSCGFIDNTIQHQLLINYLFVIYVPQYIMFLCEQ